MFAGYGRDLQRLREQIAASFDVIVVLGRSSQGEECPVMLAELSPSGEVVPLLSRASADERWSHHREPAFVAELGQRGISFDGSKLAALAGS